MQSQGLTPEEAAQRVDDLNRRNRESVEGLMDDLYALDSGDLLTDALLDEMSRADARSNGRSNQGGSGMDEIVNDLSRDVCQAENILSLSSASSLEKVEQNQSNPSFL